MRRPWLGLFVLPALLALGLPARATKKTFMQVEKVDRSGKVITASNVRVNVGLLERQTAYPWSKAKFLKISINADKSHHGARQNADVVDALLETVNTKGNLIDVKRPIGNVQSGIGSNKYGRALLGYRFINSNGKLRKIVLPKLLHFDKTPEGKYIGDGYYIRATVHLKPGHPEIAPTQTAGSE
jgi:hypothetical protein